MTYYSLVPLVAIFVYLLPVTIVLRGSQNRTRRPFLVYLVASFVWSLNSFIALTNFFPGQLWLWGALLPITGLWAVLSYFNLIGAFTRSNVRTWTGGAHAVLIILAIIAVAGYAPQVLQRSSGGEVSTDYGPWLYLTLLGGAIFIGLSIFHLVKKYQAEENPLSRNRIIYFLLGIALLVILNLRIAVPPLQKYPLEHLGNLCNALLITYATFGHKLFDMRLIIKKCFAYLSVSAVAAISYVLVFWGFHHFLHTWTGLASFAILVIAFGTTLLVYPLTRRVQKTVDRIYYGKSYDYRQMVGNFAQSANNILNLRELSEAMLMPIAKATGAAQVSLLLPSDGDFNLQFAKRLNEREQIIPLTLSKDSPIVDWLALNDAPLSRGQINAAPEFKALCEVEKSVIEAAGIELLFPMKSKRKLIGILALSKKRIGGFYSEDDIYMLKKLVDDAAAAIENAQLYAKAKESAHIDQLTGLLNHGYFHERVDAEIARCSRFGDVFSVIFLDLDFFKAYNDAHGHLAGDDILRQIALCIRRSIRGMDAAFRYGGDEFAIILPQAPLDDAHKVAERILKSVEGEMDSKGAALTCSMGLASWPTDGVVREDLLGAADAALYHSKQSGRNRISVAPELVVTQTSKIGFGHEPESAVLSTIHALAATVDAKDHSTYGHSTKTGKYATEIAQALGYSEDAIARIQAAALLHDIGKIRVSDELLAKRGPLSEKDWRPIHEHPKLGVTILKHVKGLSRCLAAIEYHHEHYDGTGYPAGLKGEDIPLDARILAVADAYDAMTSPRPYREGKATHEQAISELKQCAGTQFDPEIVRAFAALWEPVRPGEARARRNRSPLLKSEDLIEANQAKLLVR